MASVAVQSHYTGQSNATEASRLATAPPARQYYPRTLGGKQVGQRQSLIGSLWRRYAGIVQQQRPLDVHIGERDTKIIQAAYAGECKRTQMLANDLSVLRGKYALITDRARRGRRAQRVFVICAVIFNDNPRCAQLALDRFNLTV